MENVAKWQGGAWRALSGGGVRRPGQPARVHALLSAELPALGGRVLVVGGDFAEAGSLAADGLAFYTPAGWSGPGAGWPGGTTSALALHDDGKGPALYAGGSFQDGSALLRWDGHAWRTVAGGLRSLPQESTPLAALALSSFDDGGGPALFVGGDFEEAGGLLSAGLAKLHGAALLARARQR